MDRDTIRRMDPEVYQEKLEDAVMDDVACILNVNKGHSSVLHAGQSMNDMVSRLIKEEKQIVSSFYDAGTLVDVLQDAIYFKAQNISTWITSSKIDFDDPKKYHTLSFTLDMKDGPLGHGITKEGKELSTPSVTIVLQRDISEESPYGFFVKTAYPELTYQKAEETGLKINIQDFIENKLNFESTIEKAYYGLKNKYPDQKICLQNNNGNEQIKIIAEQDDCKYIAYIDEYNLQIKKADLDIIKTSNLAECFIECPDMVNIIDYTQNIIHGHNIEQNITQNIQH